jgi:ferritin-like metal-binding protein YciE
MATFTDNVRNFFAGEDNDVSLRELFLHELKDIYWAENKLTDALPTMAEAATTDVLKQAFHTHLEETRGQIARLDRVFDLLGEEAEGVTCEAMRGLVSEAEEVISETTSGTLTRDAGLIIAAQKVEHYEIASYGSLRTLARLLGQTEAANLLQENLNEEGNTDHKLTEIAESFVNERAKAETH